MNSETLFDIFWTVRGQAMSQTGVNQIELDYIKSGIMHDMGENVVITIHGTDKVV